MQLEEYREQVKVDLAFRKDKLDTESLTTHVIHDKYYNYLIEETKQLKKLEQKMAILLKAKTEYYLGKAAPEVYKEKPFDLKVKPIKADLNLYLNADEEMQRAQELIVSQEQKVKYLESIVRQISNRSFQIKNALDFMKFKVGIDSNKLLIPEEIWNE